MDIGVNERILRVIIVYLVIFVICARLIAQEPESAQSTPIVKLSPNKYKIGNIFMDAKKRQLKLPGWVNMEKGVVELLACSPGGKRHESVLVLDIVPYHLQVSLLLLGLNYGANLQYQGDPNTPQGDSVEVWVRWKFNKEEQLVRGEDLIYDLVGKKTMNHTHWIFSGSRIVNGTFMADMEGSLVTTYHDPFTIIDNPLPSGSNDELYVVNEKLVPPKDTPVEIILKAISKHKN